jgi:L-asparaginase/Glu-tRNA(Gln) amidotransferase subunit D
MCVCGRECRLPIVIVSRCPLGQNYDDFYYRGSLRKYTDRGFLVTGYEDLNPLQARLKLIVALSFSSTSSAASLDTGPVS